MYDPRDGQWLSHDPTGFAAGDTNLSRYVGNDPINFTDPTGLFAYPGVIDYSSEGAVDPAISKVEASSLKNALLSYANRFGAGFGAWLSDKSLSRSLLLHYLDADSNPRDVTLP
jgi:uncharacterized protein RhaS with RHS repeats